MNSDPIIRKLVSRRDILVLSRKPSIYNPDPGGRIRSPKAPERLRVRSVAPTGSHGEHGQVLERPS